MGLENRNHRDLCLGLDETQNNTHYNVKIQLLRLVQNREKKILKHISTRGKAPALDFEQTTLSGLAIDGGLYLPDQWTRLSEQEISALSTYNYVELCQALMAIFAGNSIPKEKIKALVSNAYGSFHHPAIAPLKQLDDKLFFLELFHGPTLAFKDFALQLLGQFFQYFLTRNNQTYTIIGATSGDTGSAAIAGIRGLSAVNLFIFHPKGRVSEVQRRQMTTITDSNIHNIAIDGTFDDCQNIVKALFNDQAFRSQHSLAAVNSINWARIAAQVVYYFYAALALGAPYRTVNFSVPTGNFGNVLAGYIAKKMGLPIKRLIIGSNKNDILTRFFQTGEMKMTGVNATISPSMDIQISSNFERYLFELLERDSDHLNIQMNEFSQTGKFSIGKKKLQQAQSLFSAYSFSDEFICQHMLASYHRTGEVIDPHSMIGLAAAQAENDQETPTIAFGTAHPAKFPEAVKTATNIDIGLPQHVGDIMTADERYLEINNDFDEIKTRINNLLTS